MDETTRTRIIELAEENGLDPAELLAVETADGLPEELRQAVADILGDLTLFGRALDDLERD